MGDEHMLTVDEQERYDRQIMIAEIGEDGQERLKKARVFIADLAHRLPYV